MEKWRDGQTVEQMNGQTERQMKRQLSKRLKNRWTNSVNTLDTLLHLTAGSIYFAIVRFVRITPDGTVSYSQRLTLAAGCPMNLVKFPLDSQNCRLEIGSFGYTANDVVYK